MKKIVLSAASKEGKPGKWWSSTEYRVEAGNKVLELRKETIMNNSPIIIFVISRFFTIFHDLF